MSTRCQVKIEGTDLLVYQHSDGHPSNMLRMLLPFVENFLKYRGHDPEYMVAQLVHHLISDSNRSMEAFYKENPGFPQPKHPSFTGFGVDKNIHGDIEYLYGVEKDGTVVVQIPNISGFTTVTKFKVGTVYEDAMARLQKLAGKSERFQCVAS